MHPKIVTETGKIKFLYSLINKRTAIYFTLIIFLGFAINTQTFAHRNGSLAIVADGNALDADNLGGTAISIASIRAGGLENKSHIRKIRNRTPSFNANCLGYNC